MNKEDAGIQLNIYWGPKGYEIMGEGELNRPTIMCIAHLLLAHAVLKGLQDFWDLISSSATCRKCRKTGNSEALEHRKFFCPARLEVILGI